MLNYKSKHEESEDDKLLGEYGNGSMSVGLVSMTL